MAKAVITIFIAACGVALWAAPASAHAIVESTEPAIDEIVQTPPTEVVMHFNEPVEVAFGAIRVYDTFAHRVDDGNVEHVEGDATSVRVGLHRHLEAGTYTVTWRVISADSHVIQEAFVFHVGEPGSRPQGIADEVLGGETGGQPIVGGLLGAMRALGYAGLLTLIGGMLFFVFVWKRVGLQADGDFDRLRRRLTAYAWWMAVIASLLAIALQGAHAAGLGLSAALDPDTITEVLKTRFGQQMALRVVLLVIAAGLWFATRRPVPVLVVGIAALIATALAGHAGSTDPIAVNVAADTIHLTAASAWIGGLAYVMFAGLPSLGNGSASIQSAAQLVRRYSDVAVVSVAVLVVTGLWQTWIEVRALRALTGTSYGITLLTKLSVFVPLVVLGAINNRWTKPAIEKATQTGNPERPLGVFKRLVAAEVVLGALVIAVTAFLVNLPPARIEAGVTGPFLDDVAFGEHELNIVVDPNRVGENEIHLTATDESGQAVEFKEMRVLFTMPEQSIGPLTGKGTELAPGHFVVQGRQLSVPGDWTLEVVGRISRFDEIRTRVPIVVNR